MLFVALNNLSRFSDLNFPICKMGVNNIIVMLSSYEDFEVIIQCYITYIAFRNIKHLYFC